MSAIRVIDRLQQGAAGVFALALLGGCSSGPAKSRERGTASAVTALPACDQPPAPSPHAAIPGLVLPEEAVITELSPQGPVTTVRAYLQMTPVQVREHYEQRDDVDLLSIEDEVFEAEVLLDSGEHRVFLRAMILCAEGSSLLAIVAPVAVGGELTVPDGTPGRTGPGG